MRFTPGKSIKVALHQRGKAFIDPTFPVLAVAHDRIEPLVSDFMSNYIAEGPAIIQLICLEGRRIGHHQARKFHTAIPHTEQSRHHIQLLIWILSELF